jgi:large subunit ribosomal protein L25
MTTTSITIQSITRTNTGKGPARRTRAQGKLPAVMYGPGDVGHPIAVDAKDVKAILASPLGKNTLVTLAFEGRSTLALLKAVEHHPLTREIRHADFYTVTLDRKIVVRVPFVVKGKAKGVASEGGILRQIFRELPVITTADKIPSKIEVDVTTLGLGESLHVRDLNLPEGVAVKLDANQTVVSVVSPEKDDGKGAASGAQAEAKAAPAKDAKAAAAKDTKAAPAKAAAPAKDAKKK